MTAAKDLRTISIAGESYVDETIASGEHDARDDTTDSAQVETVVEETVATSSESSPVPAVPQSEQDMMQREIDRLLDAYEEPLHPEHRRLLEEAMSPKTSDPHALVTATLTKMGLMKPPPNLQEWEVIEYHMTKLKSVWAIIAQMCITLKLNIRRADGSFGPVMGADFTKGDWREVINTLPHIDRRIRDFISMENEFKRKEDEYLRHIDHLQKKNAALEDELSNIKAGTSTESPAMTAKMKAMEVNYDKFYRPAHTDPYILFNQETALFLTKASDGKYKTTAKFEKALRFENLEKAGRRLRILNRLKDNKDEKVAKVHVKKYEVALMTVILPKK